MESPITTGTQIATGSVYVKDTAGLEGLSFTISISGTSTSGLKVNSTVTSSGPGQQRRRGCDGGDGAGRPRVRRAPSRWGATTVELTIAQDGAAGNTVTSTVVVQAPP